jgi:hypothetical protein
MPTETFNHQRSAFRAILVTTKGPDSSSNSMVFSGLTSWVDYRSGSPNPRWRNNIREHTSAGTPFAGGRFKISGNTTGMAKATLRAKSPVATHREIQHRVVGDIFNATDFAVLNEYSNIPMMQRVSNGALSGFYGKAWGAIRQFQGGVFLGEIRETLNMIRRPAQGIRRLMDTYSVDVRRRIKRVQRGRPVDNRVFVSDAHKVASDTWLQYALGMRPLMSDARSGAEALARLALQPHEYIKVQFTTEEEAPSPDGFPSFIREISPIIYYRFNRRTKVGYTCRIIGEVKCEVLSPLKMSAEVLGFQPSDFVPTLYELIPYSFLVDYFSNVGQVISAWSFPLGNLAWHNRVIRSFTEREIDASLQAGYFNPNPSHYDLDDESGSNLRLKLERTTVNRDQGPLGFPSVAFEVPGSSLKWLNIGALAHMRVF